MMKRTEGTLRTVSEGNNDEDVPANHEGENKDFCYMGGLYTHASAHTSFKIIWCTVEHIGDKHFVHCSEVVPCSEVEMYGQYIYR